MARFETTKKQLDNRYSTETAGSWHLDILNTDKHTRTVARKTAKELFRAFGTASESERSPEFLKQARSKLTLLHAYNNVILSRNKRYPRTKWMFFLLCRYVALEFKGLGPNPDPNNCDVEYLILVLENILAKYFDHDSEKRSKVLIVHIVVTAYRNYQIPKWFMEKLARLVLKGTIIQKQLDDIYSDDDDLLYVGSIWSNDDLKYFMELDDFATDDEDSDISDQEEANAYPKSTQGKIEGVEDDDDDDVLLISYEKHTLDHNFTTADYNESSKQVTRSSNNNHSNGAIHKPRKANSLEFPIISPHIIIIDDDDDEIESNQHDIKGEFVDSDVEVIECVECQVKTDRRKNGRKETKEFENSTIDETPIYIDDNDDEDVIVASCDSTTSFVDNRSIVQNSKSKQNVEVSTINGETDKTIEKQKSSKKEIESDTNKSTSHHNLTKTAFCGNGANLEFSKELESYQHDPHSSQVEQDSEGIIVTSTRQKNVFAFEENDYILEAPHEFASENITTGDGVNNMGINLASHANLMNVSSTLSSTSLLEPISSIKLKVTEVTSTEPVILEEISSKGKKETTKTIAKDIEDIVEEGNSQSSCGKETNNDCISIETDKISNVYKTVEVPVIKPSIIIEDKVLEDSTNNSINTLLIIKTCAIDISVKESLSGEEENCEIIDSQHTNFMEPLHSDLITTKPNTKCVDTVKIEESVSIHLEHSDVKPSEKPAVEVPKDHFKNVIIDADKTKTSLKIPSVTHKPERNACITDVEKVDKGKVTDGKNQKDNSFSTYLPEENKVPNLDRNQNHEFKTKEPEEYTTSILTKLLEESENPRATLIAPVKDPEESLEKTLNIQAYNQDLSGEVLFIKSTKEKKSEELLNNNKLSDLLTIKDTKIQDFSTYLPEENKVPNLDRNQNHEFKTKEPEEYTTSISTKLPEESENPRATLIAPVKDLEESLEKTGNIQAYNQDLSDEVLFIKSTQEKKSEELLNNNKLSDLPTIKDTKIQDLQHTEDYAVIQCQSEEDMIDTLKDCAEKYVNLEAKNDKIIAVTQSEKSEEEKLLQDNKTREIEEHKKLENTPKHAVHDNLGIEKLEDSINKEQSESLTLGNSKLSLKIDGCESKNLKIKQNEEFNIGLEIIDKTSEVEVAKLNENNEDIDDEKLLVLSKIENSNSKDLQEINLFGENHVKQMSSYSEHCRLKESISTLQAETNLKVEDTESKCIVTISNNKQFKTFNTISKECDDKERKGIETIAEELKNKKQKTIETTESQFPIDNTCSQEYKSEKTQFQLKDEDALEQLKSDNKKAQLNEKCEMKAENKEESLQGYIHISSIQTDATHPFEEPLFESSENENINEKVREITVTESVEKIKDNAKVLMHVQMGENPQNINDKAYIQPSIISTENNYDKVGISEDVTNAQITEADTVKDSALINKSVINDSTNSLPIKSSSDNNEVIKNKIEDNHINQDSKVIDTENKLIPNLEVFQSEMISTVANSVPTILQVKDKETLEQTTHKKSLHKVKIEICEGTSQTSLDKDIFTKYDVSSTTLYKDKIDNQEITQSSICTDVNTVSLFVESNVSATGVVKINEQDTTEIIDYKETVSDVFSETVFVKDEAIMFKERDNEATADHLSGSEEKNQIIDSHQLCNHTESNWELLMCNMRVLSDAAEKQLNQECRSRVKFCSKKWIESRLKMEGKSEKQKLIKDAFREAKKCVEEQNENLKPTLSLANKLGKSNVSTKNSQNENPEIGNSEAQLDETNTLKEKWLKENHCEKNSMSKINDNINLINKNLKFLNMNDDSSDSFEGRLVIPDEPTQIDCSVMPEKIPEIHMKEVVPTKMMSEMEIQPEPVPSLADAVNQLSVCQDVSSLVDSNKKQTSYNIDYILGDLKPKEVTIDKRYHYKAPQSKTFYEGDKNEDKKSFQYSSTDIDNLPHSVNNLLKLNTRSNENPEFVHSSDETLKYKPLTIVTNLDKKSMKMDSQECEVIGNEIAIPHTHKKLLKVTILENVVITPKRMDVSENENLTIEQIREFPSEHTSTELSQQDEVIVLVNDEIKTEILLSTPSKCEPEPTNLEHSYIEMKNIKHENQENNDLIKDMNVREETQRENNYSENEDCASNKSDSIQSETTQEKFENISNNSTETYGTSDDDKTTQINEEGSKNLNNLSCDENTNSNLFDNDKKIGGTRSTFMKPHNLDSSDTLSKLSKEQDDNFIEKYADTIDSAKECQKIDNNDQTPEPTKLVQEKCDIAIANESLYLSSSLLDEQIYDDSSNCSQVDVSNTSKKAGSSRSENIEIDIDNKKQVKEYNADIVEVSDYKVTGHESISIILPKTEMDPASHSTISETSNASNISLGISCERDTKMDNIHKSVSEKSKEKEKCKSSQSSKLKDTIEKKSSASKSDGKLYDKHKSETDSRETSRSCCEESLTDHETLKSKDCISPKDTIVSGLSNFDQLAKTNYPIINSKLKKNGKQTNSAKNKNIIEDTFSDKTQATYVESRDGNKIQSDNVITETPVHKKEEIKVIDVKYSNMIEIKSGKENSNIYKGNEKDEVKLKSEVADQIYKNKETEDKMLNNKSSELETPIKLEINCFEEVNMRHSEKKESKRKSKIVSERKRNKYEKLPKLTCSIDVEKLDVDFKKSEYDIVRIKNPLVASMKHINGVDDDKSMFQIEAEKVIDKKQYNFVNIDQNFCNNTKNDEFKSKTEDTTKILKVVENAGIQSSKQFTSQDNTLDNLSANQIDGVIVNACVHIAPNTIECDPTNAKHMQSKLPLSEGLTINNATTNHKKNKTLANMDVSQEVESKGIMNINVEDMYQMKPHITENKKMRDNLDKFNEMDNETSLIGDGLPQANKNNFDLGDITMTKSNKAPQKRRAKEILEYDIHTSKKRLSETKHSLITERSKSIENNVHSLHASYKGCSFTKQEYNSGKYDSKLVCNIIQNSEKHTDYNNIDFKEKLKLLKKSNIYQHNSFDIPPVNTVPEKMIVPSTSKVDFFENVDVVFPQKVIVLDQKSNIIDTKVPSSSEDICSASSVSNLSVTKCPTSTLAFDEILLSEDIHKNSCIKVLSETESTEVNQHPAEQTYIANEDMFIQIVGKEEIIEPEGEVIHYYSDEQSNPQLPEEFVNNNQITEKFKKSLTKSVKTMNGFVDNMLPVAKYLQQQQDLNLVSQTMSEISTQLSIQGNTFPLANLGFADMDGIIYDEVIAQVTSSPEHIMKEKELFTPVTVKEMFLNKGDPTDVEKHETFDDNVLQTPRIIPAALEIVGVTELNQIEPRSCENQHQKKEIATSTKLAKKMQSETSTSNVVNLVNSQKFKREAKDEYKGSLKAKESNGTQRQDIPSTLTKNVQNKTMDKTWPLLDIPSLKKKVEADLNVSKQNQRKRLCSQQETEVQKNENVKKSKNSEGDSNDLFDTVKKSDPKTLPLPSTSVLGNNQDKSVKSLSNVRKPHDLVKEVTHKKIKLSTSILEDVSSYQRDIYKKPLERRHSIVSDQGMRHIRSSHSRRYTPDTSRNSKSVPHSMNSDKYKYYSESINNRGHVSNSMNSRRIPHADSRYRRYEPDHIMNSRSHADQNAQIDNRYKHRHYSDTPNNRVHSSGYYNSASSRPLYTGLSVVSPHDRNWRDSYLDAHHYNWKEVTFPLPNVRKSSTQHQQQTTEANKEWYENFDMLSRPKDLFFPIKKTDDGRN